MFDQSAKDLIIRKCIADVTAYGVTLQLLFGMLICLVLSVFQYNHKMAVTDNIICPQSLHWLC